MSLSCLIEEFVDMKIKGEPIMKTIILCAALALAGCASAEFQLQSCAITGCWPEGEAHPDL